MQHLFWVTCSKPQLSSLDTKKKDFHKQDLTHSACAHCLFGDQCALLRTVQLWVLYSLPLDR